MSVTRLQDLPEELLISILHNLSLLDLQNCQATCHLIHDIIGASVKLRYDMALEKTGMVHNPYCRLGAAECLEHLQRREDAWRTLTPSFTRTLGIENSVSGIYELSGGSYFLGASGATNIPFIRLPSDPHTPATWDVLDVQGKIIDIGISLYEHDLFAAIVMEPTPIVKIKLYSLSQKKEHPLAKKHSLIVQARPVARLAVGVEIVGDILVLITRDVGADGVPDTVYIYNWKQGTLLKTIEARTNGQETLQGFSSVAFLTPSLVVFPNAVTKTLEVWSIDDLSSRGSAPVMTFNLPGLKEGIAISHMACRGSPNPNAFSKDPKHAFHPSFDDAIIIFHMHFSLNEHAFAGSCVFFIHRRALLPFLTPPPPQDAASIPWEEWGPPNTRWIPSGNSDWITTTAGQRYVLYRGQDLQLYDFNQNSVALARRTGKGMVIEGEHWYIDAPFREPLGDRLPFVLSRTPMPRRIEGVLMDEERILGLKRSLSGRVSEIEVVYFG